MDTSKLPSKLGQIVMVEAAESAQENVYIVVCDPDFAQCDNISVVALNDLQRNINHPENATRLSFKKSLLIVISENLEEYILSWNSPFNKRYVFMSAEDVKQFFRDLHGIYESEFHPDDDFRDYVNREGERSFTDEQAEYLNNVMTQSFQFCEDNNLDIYDIAGEVQIERWRKSGFWPIPGEEDDH